VAYDNANIKGDKHKPTLINQNHVTNAKRLAEKE
jgi:hypothetical protein